MNDVKSLIDVEKVLSEHGFKSTLNENNVLVKVGSAESPFPCVITMDETTVTICCEIDTLGRLKEKVDPFMKEDIYLAMLDLNTQTLPYAFSILSDIDGEEEDNKEDWPIVLINSIPVGDISDEELLVAMRSLISALQVAKNMYNVSVM